MVIYSQLQEAMLLAFPMSPAQLNAKISQQFWQYHQKVSAWNIQMPSKAVADFQRTGETFN